ncbi:Alpha/Beta hydrolase protein [Talaromyces proteolyticus]|uniref:Pheromone-processing carboxypeptidase KEX1 n=1 Tax=Talaromyces proteolyticus TaxID=1131652 RepID=A0AAD4KH18_9EURO|nr:Alpha/Beta hydrolase protein [Talaromyces proteolyticus]KAH8690935.1 Alpha/Beta hydrolase protein [Talaromyces proteolyticus]
MLWSDFLIHSLPGQPGGPLLAQHAGLIPINESLNQSLFFWHFDRVEAPQLNEPDKTLIWLNGGPGCSSLDGALIELGPYRLNSDGTLRPNEGSWNQNLNLLFLDQPVGTGFSSVGAGILQTELPEVTTNFMTFILNFAELNPAFQNTEIWLGGESFSGQYLPYFADAIIRHNIGNSTFPLRLGGVLAGNAYIDPASHYFALLPSAAEQNLLHPSPSAQARLRRQETLCRISLDANPHHISYRDCELIMWGILTESQRNGTRGSLECYNQYDTRLYDEWPACGSNWPPDVSLTKQWLRRTDVRRALNVPDTVGEWDECRGSVSKAMLLKTSHPSIDFLPSILAHVPVVLYSGSADLIVNHIGTEMMIANMEWNGEVGWNLDIHSSNIHPHVWLLEDGSPGGTVQVARNLTYVIVDDASHMVPFDQPLKARDMAYGALGVRNRTLWNLQQEPKLPSKTGSRYEVEFVPVWLSSSMTLGCIFSGFTLSLMCLSLFL